MQEITIEHIDTELMVTDPMTKGLPAKVHNDHVVHMGLISSFDI